ncbi:hypothetical protein [Soonwooa sp.]|uniref:DoxX family protein n=1 Tax=Soonwooa sp. TaxID=1938592 RepID=UPI00260CAB61|nr:hypothetical protein [Soonwooa sp.]
MKPLFVLLIVFSIALIASKIISSNFKFEFSGKLALSVMLVFTALGHFLYTKGMTMMLPGFIPYKTEIIYITGILEVAAAIGIWFPDISALTGILLIVFFILILPSNINAAVNHLNYETGTFDGKGLSYLWFRIPFQILLISWTYYFVIR